ncbi:MAG TPA: hypothetical protein VHA56_09150 [Mucilaginibacter sp.]|nr:hypothetical protein [Mucilaginibacter sp.]
MDKFDDVDLELIDNCFGGDAEKYEAALSDGDNEVIRWKDLHTAAMVHPDQDLSVHKLIERLLGYRPPSCYTLPFEPFLRELLNAFDGNNLTEDELYEQAEDVVKLIRNRQVENNSCLDYDQQIYQKYIDYLPQFTDQVKYRLTKLLGYEPELRHSVAVEIFLRECLVDDRFYMLAPITKTDIQAITIIKYREILLAQGKQAADASPLIAVDLLLEMAA